MYVSSETFLLHNPIGSRNKDQTILGLVWDILWASDYFILFFDKFCYQLFKICKRKTKNFNSRNDLLKKLYKIGEEKINNEFSIERVLYTLR